MRDTRAQRRVGRLTKRRDFVAAALGRRFHTERMTLQGRQRADDGATEGLRVGITVTKRVGHATERNRIKRRLRAALRDVCADKACIAADVVVVARRPAISADYRLLLEELARAVDVVTKPKSPRPHPPNRSADGRGRGSTHA
jgi:ribonuclease P protein component